MSTHSHPSKDHDHDRELTRDDNRALAGSMSSVAGADSAAFMQSCARGAVVFIGLIVVLIGVYYACRFVNDIHGKLTHPAGAKTTIEEWRNIIGGEGGRDLDIPLGRSGSGPETAPTRVLGLATPVAILVLAMGYFFLFWLTLRIILTGTKIMMLPLNKADKR